MPVSRIHQLLSELRRELGDTSGLAADERAAIGRIAEELGRIAQDQPAAGATESVLGELRDRTLRLESEHPRLAAVLGQVADALGKLGI
jgi:hypothetical protein